MRIKNKEINRRRHRKEQVVKAAQREVRRQYSGEKKPAAIPAAAQAKKTATHKPDAAPVAKKPTAPKKPAAEKKPATAKKPAAKAKKAEE